MEFDFFDLLDRRSDEFFREEDARDFLSDKEYAKNTNLYTNPLLLGDREEAAIDFLSDKAYADTNPDMITSDSSAGAAGLVGAGLKAASQLMDKSGSQKVIQGKMPSMPGMPSASRAGYNPTPEPIQYGVPLEVLTNMQLRQQAEGYLRDLYRQARQSIRQPNVISLI